MGLNPAPTEVCHHEAVEMKSSAEVARSFRSRKGKSVGHVTIKTENPYY
jgi:hypothetical protein